MVRGKVALFLVERSDFQELLRKDAEAAARRSGVLLETYFTGHDFAGQVKQVRDCIDGPEPPNAVVVLPVRDHGFGLTVRTALRAGISFVYIDRTEDDLIEASRDATNGAVVSQVCPDEMDTGRIQGRQFRALLPQGGKVLYIQGSRRSLSGRDRTMGMEEAVRGSAIEVTPVEAGFGTEEARKAVLHRLKLLGRIHAKVDLIGCQTDQIALGALKALDEAAVELHQPDIAYIRVTGCDATPELGQKLVAGGRMAASISLPHVSGPAVEAVARHLQGAAMPPTLFFKAASFPPENELKAAPIARKTS
jgi:ABC-type sugar transport system substrate-binding protein